MKKDCVITSSTKINYSYVVSSDRPPVTKTVEAEVENWMVCDECKGTYLITDKMSACTNRREIIDVIDACAHMSSLNFFLAKRLRNNRKMDVLVVRGSYFVKIQFVDCNDSVRTLGVNECFEKVISLKRECTDIKNIYVDCIDVNDILWYKDKLFLKVVMKLDVEC